MPAPDAPRAGLTRRALLGLARLHAAVALVVFLPAWTVDWWQAWLCWGLLTAAALAITLHFLKRDPAFVESRMSGGPFAEPIRGQKAIQAVSFLIGIAMAVTPGFELRSSGLPVPWWLTLLADAVMVAAMALMFRVFRVNRHASAVVEVTQGQRVISAGPYAVVRHPMYSCAAILFLATPLALGSYLALAFAVPLCLMLAVRLLHEERFLSRGLPGYDDYRRQVRRRLVPGVW